MNAYRQQSQNHVHANHRYIPISDDLINTLSYSHTVAATSRSSCRQQWQLNTVCCAQQRPATAAAVEINKILLPAARLRRIPL
jgi:hypothetical protein